MTENRNPYRLDPVENPRLLRTRRTEINRAVEAIAPHEGRSRHALIVGDERTGRTSVLTEVARRASADQNCLVVWLRLLEEDLTTSGLQRAVLNATVEAIVAEDDPVPDWYLAWCDRVHLRDPSVSTFRDRLISGLILASDSAAIVDRSVLQRDLRTLSRLATERGRSRIVICLDDADALLEDITLVEELLDSVALGGEWSFAMTTTTTGSDHLEEAVSPSLRRFAPVWLAPFWTPDKIRTCLTAPLDPDDVEALMPDNPLTLIVDLLRLTGGNPFEIAVIAQQLWVACRLGEQERYELTPRVLERALRDIARYTGAEAELVAGARAIQELDPDRIGPALDLLALSALTIREVAIARLLGVPNDDDIVSKRLLTASLDEETARVTRELEELEGRGVVVLDDAGGFTVRGGHAVIVALKYQAQSLLGPDRVDKPFGIPFLPCVGQPLAADYARRAAAKLQGARRLASAPAFAVSASASSARLRAALDTRPFAGLDIEALALDEETHERMADLVLDPGLASIAVINLTLVAGDRQLDWIEVWEVPPGAEVHDLNESLSGVLDDWQRLALAAGVQWRGAHAVVFRDDDARALIQLCPLAADAALYRAWNEWSAAKDGSMPGRVLGVADATVQALKAHRVPDWERGWELSRALSRQGFLLSFSDGRLDEARAALELAKERGPADGWVTEWNLANIAARTGELSSALSMFDGLADEASRAKAAHLLFFVPDRDAVSTIVAVEAGGVEAVLSLQRVLLAYLIDRASVDDLRGQIERCADAGDTATKVADWVRESVFFELSDPTQAAPPTG